MRNMWSQSADVLTPLQQHSSLWCVVSVFFNVGAKEKGGGEGLCVNKA